jgi:hypothetical protein
MDCEATDFRVLDVSRRVSVLSFCYFTDDEVRALSVCEISQAAAFDDLGSTSGDGADILCFSASLRPPRPPVSLAA